MSNIITLRKKQPEPRVLDALADDGNMTGQMTPENKTVDGSLTAAFYLVREILNKPETIATLEKEHPADEISDILTGALCMARDIYPGQQVAVTAMANDTAAIYQQYSYRMLTDKSKPALIAAGVLVKLGNKYRWAQIDELTHVLMPDQCPAPTAPAPQSKPAIKDVIVKSAKALKPQKLIDAHQRNKAKRDPWIELLPDGTIQKHRKAFTGEYSAAEKKAIRDAYERNSYAKLLTKNPELTEEAQQLAQQKQLEMIERKAALEAQMDTLKMWAKIISFVVVAWFVIGTVSKDPQPVQAEEEVFLPSGIYGDSE